MVAVKARAEGAVAALQAALKNAILFVPLRDLPTEHEVGDTVHGANVPLHVMLARDENGSQHLAVFTSETELTATFPGQPPYLGIPFSVLAQLAAQAPILDVVIDRNGATPVTTPPGLLTSWAQPAGSAAPSPAPAPTTTPPPAQIGAVPRVMTFQQLQVLEGLLRQQEGLVQAYLFGVLQGTPPPLLTVGLGFIHPPTPERMQSMVKAISQIVGASGVLVLDHRLPLLLARQMGVIRFDFPPVVPPLSHNSEGASPPDPHPPQ